MKLLHMKICTVFQNSNQLFVQYVPLEGFINVDCCGVLNALRDAMTLLNISTFQDAEISTHTN